jgi:hypothetical protein
MKRLVPLTFWVLSACGGGSSGSSVKLFNSTWEYDLLGLAMDLSDTVPGSSDTFKYIHDNGLICECAVETTGTGENGEFNIKTCTYSSGGSGDDGFCSNYSNWNGTYKIESNLLNICSLNNSCEVYR